jgi:hypothetical protein
MAQLAPFRAGTRQRFAFVNSVAHSVGATLSPIELPRVGMLSRIILQFRGTVSFSASGTAADLGPWNLLSRLQVNANIGSASIVDCSGFGLFMVQPTNSGCSVGFRPDLSGVGSSAAPSADIFAAPLAAGNNTWALSWIIPIGANTGNQFDLGLVNLQAPETRVTVNITTGALTDPATNLGSFTNANWFVYYEYYEIPDPSKYALPPLALVRTIEETQAITGTGDTIYTVPRQGVLLQLTHRVTLNGARLDTPSGWDSAKIRFNKTDTVYNTDRQPWRVIERARYALQVLTGVYQWDFWQAAADVSQGDTRDAIDSEELSTLESILTVNSGATLGSNNNFFSSVRRIVQILE